MYEKHKVGMSEGTKDSHMKRIYRRGLEVGILTTMALGQQASLAQQSPQPPVDLRTCAPVFHYWGQQADQARSVILECAKRCGELLDPTPRREDPMFNMCEDARLNPDPRRPSWYKV